jgi:carbonic anhydrase
MSELKFGVIFKNPETQKKFLEIELKEQAELTVREQIELLKQNPAALVEWARQEKVKNRNKHLIKCGLHPVA